MAIPNMEDQPDPADEGQSQIDRRYLELQAQLLDVKGLRNMPKPEPLIDDYLYKDSIAWLGGKPGHGKSFLAVDLACCVATGTDWFGKPVKAGPVLYVIAEGASGLSLRVDAWELATGVTVQNVTFLPVPVQLLQGVDVAAFALILGDLEPSLVIVDTQARVTVGAEENSSKDMGQFVDSLEILRRGSKACILVVHHEPRNGENLRGSTALEGAATTILRVCKDGEAITVATSKQKDVVEQPDFTVALQPIGQSAHLVVDHGIGSTTETEYHILTTLQTFGRQGAGKTELRDACDLSKSSWYRGINALVMKHLVDEIKEGRRIIYTLPADDTQGTFDDAE